MNEKKTKGTRVLNFIKEMPWQKLCVIGAVVVLIVLVLSVTGTTLKELIGLNGDVKEINQRIEIIEKRFERVEKQQDKILEILLKKD